MVAASHGGGTSGEGVLFAIEPPVATHRARLSPKRPQVETAALADAFPYYAGFSFDWAKHQLSARVGEDRAAVVLDPWNGSGTTTLAAQAIGAACIGIDLNPVANIVARLRAQVGVTADALSAPPKSGQSDSLSDPLSAWLHPSTVSRVRDWTRAIEMAPTDAATLGLVSLFRVMRKLTKGFEGSNPTWVRRAASDDLLVHITSDELDRLLLADQRHLLWRLGEEPRPDSNVTLITASSTRLPIADEVIDVVLTSPPSLTRIDYAVAYTRELAVCGIDISADRNLRETLMGTTLIRSNRTSGVEYGALARDLVDKISSHRSKASSGYYLKQARQYLDDLTASFDEIHRVCKLGATMMIVVQDSYYKDIPVRLADICAEEMADRGWSCLDRQYWEVNRILTAVNTAARAYDKGQVLETVLVLKKEAE